MKARKSNSSGVCFDMLEQRQLFAADMVVNAIITEPQVLERFTGFKATIKVANIGDTTILPGANVRMAFSRDDIYRNADDLTLGLYKTTNALGPGDIETFEIDRRVAAQPTGQFRFFVEVDPFNAIPENSGSNNVSSTDGVIVTYYEKLNSTTIDGTLGDDRISFSQAGGMAIVDINGKVQAQKLSELTELIVDAAAGDDRIVASPDFPVRLAITGAGGNDTIVGGAGNDELSGANGKDRIFGGAGDDYLLGGASNDKLNGEDGNDTCSGAGGKDMLYGGAGINQLFGGAGNDRLFSSGNGNTDTLGGGAGIDTADADPFDVKGSIEK